MVARSHQPLRHFVGDHAAHRATREQVRASGLDATDFVDIARRHVLDPRQWLSTTIEADRLQSLVDRLLAPHRSAPERAEEIIHEVCERVRSLVLVEFPLGLKIERDYDISIPEFRGDRERLIQSVLNLVQNAAHALERRIMAGDAVIRLRTRVLRQITLGKRRYKLALELLVIDNGPGVPAAMQDQVFYPLVTGKAGGTGLGLTLAQSYVQQHQGLIECESVPGRTVFRVLIPLE